MEILPVLSTFKTTTYFSIRKRLRGIDAHIKFDQISGPSHNALTVHLFADTEIEIAITHRL